MAKLKFTFRDDLELVQAKVDCVKLVIDLDLKTNISLDYVKYALANARLFDRKQQDYGPKNIGRHGSYGILVRMEDKYERLDHLFKNRRRKTANESIRDSFTDMHVYGNIALLCEDGKWPMIGGELKKDEQPF